MSQSITDNENFFHFLEIFRISPLLHPNLSSMILISDCVAEGLPGDNSVLNLQVLMHLHQNEVK